jgi:metal-dependent amidase/aminoacylase/carboxypeptidase family protein
MIADGAAEGIDLALGFHNQPDMPVGTFGYARGRLPRASDRFDLEIRGKSGHARTLTRRSIPSSRHPPSSRRRRRW